MDRLKNVLERAAEEIENIYDRETELSIELRNVLALAGQGRLVKPPCKVGDTVYVVERDEDGEACEVSGYILIASCRDAVIVSPRINGSDDVGDILEHQIAETVMQYNGDLAVFPAEDCYSTLEEAEAKLAEKGGGSDETD